MKAKISKVKAISWKAKLLAILLALTLVPISTAVKTLADDGQRQIGEMGLEDQDKWPEKPADTEDVRGTLVVKKTVLGGVETTDTSLGEGLDKDKVFNFQITPIPSGDILESVALGKGELQRAIKFSLKDGEEKRFDLKVKYQYKITELNPEGYEVAGSIVHGNPGGYSKKVEFTGAETTVSVNAERLTTVTFKNTPLPEVSDFVVEKTVVGNEDCDERFPFALWVKGMENKELGALKFDDQAWAKFKLAAGERMILEGLPAGRDFKLQEMPVTDYTPHYSVEKGKAEVTEKGVIGCTQAVPTVILVINKFAGFGPIVDDPLPPTIDVKVKKIWEGGESPRPEIEFELYREVPGAHGSVKLETIEDAIKTLKDGETELVWPGMPRTNDKGVEYKYYVVELTELDDYRMERVDYLTIKNVYTGSPSVDPPPDGGDDPPPEGDEGPGELVLGDTDETGSGEADGSKEMVLGEGDVKAPATGEMPSYYLYLGMLLMVLSLIVLWKGSRVFKED